MQFCLVRDALSGGSAKPCAAPSPGSRLHSRWGSGSNGALKTPKVARGTLIRTRRLTIGSAPTQHLQLSAEDAAPRHAVLTAGLGGRLQLVALSGKSVTVNGHREVKAPLWPGDTVQLGNATISIEKSRSEGIVVLRIQEPPETDGPACAVRELIERETPGPNMSLWSWSLTIAVAVLFLIVPLSGVVLPAARQPLRALRLLPSDALWSPGPLHAAHQSIGTNCNACHKTPFARVRDEECAVCHGDVQHHVDVRTSDTSLFNEERCESCHHEHKQPAALVQRDPRLCTDCHAHLDRLKPQPRVENATDFGTAHPEFRLAVLQTRTDGAWHASWIDRREPDNFIEHSHLRFSHATHLDPKGIKSPTGERVLSCQDCHRPNSSGREMLPIRMETHCASCHSLRFDEHDPTSGVPHGNLQAVYKTLQEHFSGEYLHAGASASRVTPAGGVRRPGVDSRALTPEEQMRAREWVDSQSVKIASELLEKRVCVDCHEVTRMPARTGLEQWRVEPVRLTQRWMPRARFNHAAHTTQQCTSCHKGADRSKHSTDILMPTIAQCRECHGGADDSTKVASDCVMCHQFHLPNRGRLLVTAGSTRKNST